MAEEWRDVVGYEGIYQVSNLGRVRSVSRIGTRVDGSKYPIKGCMIKRRIGKRGYETVLLHRNKNVTQSRVDALVANAFISVGTDDQFVHHINGDVIDSCADNLKWISKHDHNDAPAKSHPIDEIEGEEWRDIPKTDGVYQVSNIGRVRSNDRLVNTVHGSKRMIRGRIMHPHKMKNGYIALQLSGKTAYIHRLIAEAFIPNPDNLPCVDHIDGNKSNNSIENLRWCTYKQNTNYAIENGLFNPSATVKAFHATEAGRQLRERQRRDRSRPVIRDDGVVYPSARAAADAIGYNYSSIKDVLMGRAKRCNGHSYRYADGSKSKANEGWRKGVLQIDPITHEVVATYPSRSEAVVAMDNTGIGNCLRGAAKTSAGFIWRYADDEEQLATGVADAALLL